MIERQIESMQQGADEAVAATRGHAGGNGAVPRADAAPRARRRAALLHRQAPGDRAAEGRNRDRRKGRRRRAGAAGLRPDGDPQRQPGIPAAAEGPRDDEDAHRRAAAPAGGDHQRRSATTRAASKRRPGSSSRLVSLQREYDLERASYGDLTGKRQTALLERGAAAQAGRRAVRRARAGRPAVRAVQAEADARDADGALPRAWSSAARSRSAASTSIARSTTPVVCATNSSCRCWRRFRASNR